MTRREAALAAWQHVRDNEDPTKMAYLRRTGHGARYDAPPAGCRALEHKDGDGVYWEFYYVEKQPSDLPRYSRWGQRLVFPDIVDRNPGRVYLAPDATIEDAWRRLHLERYPDLLAF